MKLGPKHAKAGILWFWAAWSCLIFLSNMGDAFVGLGVLPEDFTLASGNFRAIVEVIAVHGLPAAMGAVLFAGVLVWDAVNTTLFLRAAAGQGKPGGDSRVDAAFVVALALWCSMILADEIFLSYRVDAFEATHRSILVTLLASYLTVRLLPEG